MAWRYARKMRSLPAKALTSISSVERGRWKLVSSRSTTRKRNPGYTNSPVSPLNSPVCAAVSRARSEVVPTASTRRPRSASMETAAQTGELSGETGLFVYPGFRFRVVDRLLTNFHLPRSTLLMLVSAFAGKDRIFRAYRHAIEKRYRFFSYGDAMLIER